MSELRVGDTVTIAFYDGKVWSKHVGTIKRFIATGHAEVELPAPLPGVGNVVLRKLSELKSRG